MATALGVVIVDQSIAARTRDFINDAVALGYTRDQGARINSSFRETARQIELDANKGTGDVSGRVATPGTNGYRQSYPNWHDDPQHFFAGGYGPFASNDDAIKHNQKVAQDAGGKNNLGNCVLP